jgi:hypothetical protein
LKQLLYISLICLAFVSCRSAGTGSRSKPAWVQNRPVNEAYYIGIGIASKSSNPFDYQQVAKKNALNDLTSEIKVTVSSNSVLSQLQNNKEFRQQFETDIKVTALNTIEAFNVVDSWEDRDHFWIYYRLSKEELRDIRRRKMQSAIDQAQEFFARSETFSREQFMQSIRLKVKALSVLQQYLNEDVQTMYKGRNIYLVNELINAIQSQLYMAKVSSRVTLLQGKVGKPIIQPFDVRVSYRDSQNGPPAIPFFPLELESEQGRIDATRQMETDQSGIASFAITRILDKSPVQTIRISADMKRIMKVDSLNQSLQTLLLSLDMPSTTIRINVQPIKVYLQTEEKNLSKAMPVHYFESVLKKSLAEDGCIFVNAASQADYMITVRSNTKALGVIWGNMKTASLDMSLSLTDLSSQAETYKEALQEIKGFQTDDENAGIDAYKTASQQLMSRMYPTLKQELMRSE